MASYLEIIAGEWAAQADRLADWAYATLAVDPKGPAEGKEWVVRSVSWGTDPQHARCAFRAAHPPVTATCVTASASPATRSRSTSAS